MFRSPEDITSSSSDSSLGESYMAEDELHESKSPLGESPAESIERGTTIPPSLSPRNADNGPYHEITAGSSPEHADALDLDADGHASLMTAALLEFYCKSRALEILNGQKAVNGPYTQDSPEVQMLGKRLYEYKSRFLSSHGVIANGIDGDDWDSARQYYRDSLDTLGLTALENLQLDPNKPRSPNNGVVASRPGSSRGANRQFGAPDLQRRITDRENVTPVLRGPSNFTSLLHLPQTIPASIPLLRQPSGQATLQSSRYAAEFTEIRLIGKGSFGSVYHVSNHVDGQNYAVKKIPISGKRLRQFQDGLRDLENLLKEIRTLARLDHLNIVRYFGAWVEHSAPSVEAHNRGARPGIQQPLLSRDPATDNESDTGGVVFEDDSDGIVFENSSNSANVADGARRASSHSTLGTARSGKGRSLGNGEEESEDIESIPRQFSIPTQDPTTTVSGTDQDIFTDDMGDNKSNMQVGHRNRPNLGEPVITLHIQMSLHPISLASYLSPLSQSGARDNKQTSPRHCYHIIPSLKLILGVISGVEYLHAKGIVHRDLKPGNIFLSPCETTAHACPSCKDTATNVPCYTIPRIGDFGLVAEITEFGEPLQNNTPTMSHPPKPPQPHKRVGTEFYRPPLFDPPPSNPGDDNMDMDRRNPDEPTDRNRRSNSTSYVNEKLDVYALGVILFELLYKLDTRMERQLVLFDLTRATSTKHESHYTDVGTTLPADFRKKVDDPTLPMNSNILDSLVTCIQGMLHPDHEKRWSCKAVRECLGQILSSSEANSPT